MNEEKLIKFINSLVGKVNDHDECLELIVGCIDKMSSNLTLTFAVSVMAFVMAFLALFMELSA